MSKITLTFIVQVIDFTPNSTGRVDVVFYDGNNFQTLYLNLREGVATYRYFQEVLWVGGAGGELNNTQAGYYAQAFKRDYKDVGNNLLPDGVRRHNMTITVVNNTVEIEAEKGTFDSWTYTGNRLIVSAVIDNTTQPTQVSLVPVRDPAIGDCNTIQYSATATGDDTPFELYDGTTLIQGGWNGSNITFNLTRGVPHSLNLYDSFGVLVKTETVIVPRKLIASEFKESSTKFVGYSDVAIQSLNPVSGTTPVQYALTDTADTTGSNYQASNAFAGVLPGSYKLWIKDVYGCEVNRIINISSFNDITETEELRWFKIPEGQSIPFAEFVSFNKDDKPNYFNTGSYNEMAEVLYRNSIEFDAGDALQGIQFQSSYPFHTATIYHDDGTSSGLAVVEIQTNLNVKEKLDCMLFPIDGKTGVYFAGGNYYIPDTDTPTGEASEYNGTTPRWVEEGQVVAIDGIGTFFIEATGFDDTNGGYFVINTATASEVPGKVQVTYNRHPYNLFEMYIDPSTLTKTSFIVLDKSLDGTNNEGNPYVSECLRQITDTDQHLLLKWKDSRNRGDIVFQSGISYLFRRAGEFYGEFTDNTSEVFPGDSQTHSLEQKVYINFTLTFEMLSAKLVNMLNIASKLENFSVNGLKLIPRESPEITRLGKSNVHTWSCVFAFGANQVAVQDDEIVLSVDTGNFSGTIPDLGGITLYKNQQGKLVLSPAGLLNRT